MNRQSSLHSGGFSLVEVVLAMGIVSFAVLTTVGLLAVGNQTNKSARDESFAAQIVTNEFERLRSSGSTSTFWSASPPTYAARYFDSNMADLGTSTSAAAKATYVLSITVSPIAAPAAADMILNAEVRSPAGAAAANQTVVRFTTLMNVPKP